MIYLLFISIFLTFGLTLVYNYLFTNKTKLKNSIMFENIGNSAKSLTDITYIFGIATYKNDLGENKNIACYSYRGKIKKGTKVLITDFDIEKQLYVVDEYPNIQ